MPFGLFDLKIRFVSFLCFFFLIFFHRREKLSIREKKKRKKRVVTVGMCIVHVKINVAVLFSVFPLYLLFIWVEVTVLCCSVTGVNPNTARFVFFRY